MRIPKRPGKIDARLDRYYASLREYVLHGIRYTGPFVDLHADAVPQAMAKFLPIARFGDRVACQCVHGMGR